MSTIKDIKIVLFAGYAIAYFVALAGPVFFDPLLSSHVMFPSRHYRYWYLCLPIYGVLLAAEAFCLRKAQTVRLLYFSIIIFLAAIALSLPIFVPEFPHGNLVSVGITSAAFSAISIFIWSMGEELMLEQQSLQAAGNHSLDYIKEVSAFLRQAAFAAVALFGVLFIGSFTTAFGYVQGIATSEADRFLLNANVALQIGFYTIYVICGAFRYFFMTNVRILRQFKEIAFQLDRSPGRDPQSSKAKK
jgi:hypothetical protein